MKRISSSFYRPEQVNIREYENIVGKLELDLQHICTEETDELSIYCYVYRTVCEAKPLENCPGMYFLGLDDPGNMPEDVRCDYFYRPTYLATAIILKAVLLHPEFLDEKQEMCWENEDACRSKVKEVLPGLMLGCTGRGFAGSGSGGLEGLIGTLRIFAMADTDRFLEKYPELCGGFTEAYHAAMQMLEQKAEEGSLQNAWGEDYGREAAEVLKLRKR